MISYQHAYYSELNTSNLHKIYERKITFYPYWLLIKCFILRDWGRNRQPHQTNRPVFIVCFREKALCQQQNIILLTQDFFLCQTTSYLCCSIPQRDVHLFLVQSHNTHYLLYQTLEQDGYEKVRVTVRL